MRPLHKDNFIIVPWNPYPSLSPRGLSMHRYPTDIIWNLCIYFSSMKKNWFLLLYSAPYEFSHIFVIHYIYQCKIGQINPSWFRLSIQLAKLYIKEKTPYPQIDTSRLKRILNPFIFLSLEEILEHCHAT